MTDARSLLFLSAGAGSGKTYRLAHLLHDALAAKRARPAGVIATTFTVKAATELRERVRSHLYGQGEFALANSLAQARIGTVNAICGSLLQQFCFEAGLSPAQEVLDEAAARMQLSRAIDSAAEADMYGSFLPIVRRLGLDEVWQQDLAQLVKEVRSNNLDLSALAGFAASSADALLSHFPPPCADDLSAVLRAKIDAALPGIEAGYEQGGRKKNTAGFLDLLRPFRQALDFEGPAWSAWAGLSKASAEASLRPLWEPLTALAGRLAEHPLLQADLRSYLMQIFALCGKALAAYQQAKRELGVIDFTDQESLLLDLLDQPAVCQALSEELDLLLVDEFQDTSPIQLALFLRLQRLAKETVWVGDVKQAIYGFRGSDSQLMDAVLKSLPALGGMKEILGKSYRSRKDLVKVVNAAFVPAFAPQLSAEEIELEAERADELPGPSLVNWILGGKNVDLEGAAVAAGVRRLIGEKYRVLDKTAKTPRDVRYGDIAILARSNDKAKKLASALAAAGIPVAIERPGLLATPEATLAVACLRRLNDPADTIATAQILSLCDSLPGPQWIAGRLRYLAAGGEKDRWAEVDTKEQEAHPVVARLAAMRERLPLLAPSEALKVVISECDLARTVLGWSNDADVGRVRLANLEALISRAGEYEELSRGGRHAASISGLIIWLGELAQAKEDSLASPAINAVQVMTHHAAKGLEWPVVILTDLHADVKSRLWGISASSGAAFDAQAPLAGRTLRYWPWPFGGHSKLALGDTIALTPLAAQCLDAAIKENKRLLYVSMTRARDLLVLARSSRKDGAGWLATLSAPWLMTCEGEETVVPPRGESVRASLWELTGEPLDPPRVEEGLPLRWFPAAKEKTSRLPLIVSPSSAAPAPLTVSEKTPIGKRIALRKAIDMALLGNALHACIATSFSDPGRPISEEEVEKILAASGVDEAISSHEIHSQIQSLHTWIAHRWPSAIAHPEWPVESITADGQWMVGRVDLLLRVDDGWVILDHKSSPLAADQWDRLASEYGGQLAAYADCIQAASGLSVLESWLFLPVAGGAVRAT